MTTKTELYQATGRLRAARREMAQLAGSLNDEFGQVFDDREHARRIARIRTLHQESVAAAEAQVQTWRTQAQRERSLTNLDPAATLTTGSLQRAAALAPLVRDFVTGASSAMLADRLEAVALDGDTEAAAVYLQYASLRLEADNHARKAGERGTLDGVHLARIRNAAGELAAAVFERTGVGTHAAAAIELDTAIVDLQNEMAHGEGSDIVVRLQAGRNKVVSGSIPAMRQTF